MFFSCVPYCHVFLITKLRSGCSKVFSTLLFDVFLCLIRDNACSVYSTAISIDTIIGLLKIKYFSYMPLMRKLPKGFRMIFTKRDLPHWWAGPDLNRRPQPRKGCFRFTSYANVLTELDDRPSFLILKKLVLLKFGWLGINIKMLFLLVHSENCNKQP